jgi:hypothetical protein
MGVGSESYVSTLALSRDGFIALAVGLSDLESDAGSVKVFRLESNVFLTCQQLDQDIFAAEPGDGFGSSLALSADGNIVAGGAWAYSNDTGYAQAFCLNDQKQ